jgi:hypothetical protein
MTRRSPGLEAAKRRRSARPRSWPPSWGGDQLDVDLELWRNEILTLVSLPRLLCARRSWRTNPLRRLTGWPGSPPARWILGRVSADRVTYEPSPAVLRTLARRYRRQWVDAADADTRGHFETIMPPSDLLAQAVAAGVMFTEPRILDHDGWVGAAQHGAAAVTADEVGEAFLASLSSGRMDLRSAQASYALIRHFPDHPYAEQSEATGCAICGISRRRDGTAEPHDLNIFSQARFGWGGIPGDIQYAAFDVEQFARAPRLSPTAEDIGLGQRIIDYLRLLPPKTTAARAARGLTMVPGTRDQRDTVMEILGICGILHSPATPATPTLSSRPGRRAPTGLVSASPSAATRPGGGKPRAGSAKPRYTSSCRNSAN